jgi:hypothetical protein
MARRAMLQIEGIRHQKRHARSITAAAARQKGSS